MFWQILQLLADPDCTETMAVETTTTFWYWRKCLKVIMRPDLKLFCKKPRWRYHHRFHYPVQCKLCWFQECVHPVWVQIWLSYNYEKNVCKRKFTTQLRSEQFTWHIWCYFYAVVLLQDKKKEEEEKSHIKTSLHLVEKKQEMHLENGSTEASVGGCKGISASSMMEIVLYNC